VFGEDLHRSSFNEQTRAEALILARDFGLVILGGAALVGVVRWLEWRFSFLAWVRDSILWILVGDKR
jgi:hypothetical protein